MDHSFDRTSGDAALAQEAQYVHIQCRHQCDQSSIAPTLVRKRQQQRVKPSKITYSAVISACEKGQQWIPAPTLLRKMWLKHMKPFTDTYSAAISACEKGQQSITATTLFLKMQQWQRSWI